MSASGSFLALATLWLLMLLVTLAGLQFNFLASGLIFGAVGVWAAVLFARGYRWGRFDQIYFLTLALVCICIAIGLLGQLLA